MAKEYVSIDKKVIVDLLTVNQKVSKKWNLVFLAFLIAGSTITVVMFSKAFFIDLEKISNATSRTMILNYQYITVSVILSIIFYFVITNSVRNFSYRFIWKDLITSCCFFGLQICVLFNQYFDFNQKLFQDQVSWICWLFVVLALCVATFLAIVNAFIGFQNKVVFKNWLIYSVIAHFIVLGLSLIPLLYLLSVPFSNPSIENNLKSLINFNSDESGVFTIFLSVLGSAFVLFVSFVAIKFTNALIRFLTNTVRPKIMLTETLIFSLFVFALMAFERSASVLAANNLLKFTDGLLVLIIIEVVILLFCVMAILIVRKENNKGSFYVLVVRFSLFLIALVPFVVQLIFKENADNYFHGHLIALFILFIYAMFAKFLNPKSARITNKVINLSIGLLIPLTLAYSILYFTLNLRSVPNAFSPHTFFNFIMISSVIGGGWWSAVKTFFAAISVTRIINFNAKLKEVK